MVEAEADGDVLMRFTDPADSAGYGARAVRRAGAAGAGVLRANAGRALPVPQVRHRVRARLDALAISIPGLTLAEPATLAATELRAKRDDLSLGLRLVLQEQEVILRSVLAARSTPRRWP